MKTTFPRANITAGIGYPDFWMTNLRHLRCLGTVFIRYCTPGLQIQVLYTYENQAYLCLTLNKN